MNRPKTLGPILAAALLAAVALVAGFYWGRSHGKAAGTTEEGAAEAGPVAAVKVAPIVMGKLEGQVSAFGSIVPAPGASQTISVAYECRVASVAIREGQVVAPGTALLTVTDSPDSLLALEQSRIDLRAAEASLQQTRSRHELKLADNGQLAQAQQAFDSAQTKVKSLEARHKDEGVVQILRASAPGVVLRIPTQVGAVVLAGSSLVELADTSKLEARLGVEPQDAARLRPGGPLNLAAVDGKNSITAQARLRTLSPAINPTTRLRDAYVALPVGHGFVLGQYVSGKLNAEAHEGLIVPYAAVLPDEGRFVLFTVRNGHARRHEVVIVLQNGDRTQVSGKDLDPAEPVVVQGNYELKDGMAVRVEQVP